MKILCLLTHDLESPTGVGRFFPLSRELVKLGHQVSIAALHSNFESLEIRNFTREGVKVHYVGQMHVHKTGSLKKYYTPSQLIKVSAYATWALTQAALQIPADIIHVAKPHPMNSIAGVFAKHVRKRTLVLDVSDYEAAINRFGGEWQRKTITYFENKMPHHADCITTHSSFLHSRLLSLGVPDKKIAYLPNGVDFGRFSEFDENKLSALRKSLGLENKRVVAYVGTLTAKAHPVDQLMEAFQQVLQRIPNAVLLIIGGGDDFENFQNQARAFGIESATIFCGRVPAADVNYYYRLADISVDPVNDDVIGRGRFPIKLFESWATGVPFVTADVGDRRSLLEQPRAGMIAQPGEVDSLADAILQLLENPNLSENIRENGYLRAKDFDWKVLAKQMETVYLDLLS